MNNYLVYKHTSPSGKSYIGITNNYSMRCNNHRRTTACPAIAAAIRKYGWDNFTHEILQENLTLDEANTMEQQFIKEHNTLYPNGYNLTTGGKVGKKFPHTEERKRAVSEKLKGRRLSKERILKNCRKYVITDPSGHVFCIANLYQFCKDHQLNSGAMANVARGALKQYKGWLVVYDD